jgi:hypothetical protein
VFGRDKTQTSPAASATSDTAVVKADGKGRATPSRREAEQRNRKPLVGAPALAPGATKAERKAARAAQTARNREERLRTREALASGDEKNLPVRDKGPGRRLVRDYVDARRNMGEFFLPLALVSVVLSMLPVPALKVISLLTLYGLVIAIVIDAILLRRKVIKVVTQKFGAPAAAGVGGYAIMRSLQIRRSRLPRPQVQRGQFPVL